MVAEEEDDVDVLACGWLKWRLSLLWRRRRAWMSGGVRRAVCPLAAHCSHATSRESSFLPGRTYSRSRSIIDVFLRATNPSCHSLAALFFLHKKDIPRRHALLRITQKVPPSTFKKDGGGKSGCSWKRSQTNTHPDPTTIFWFGPSTNPPPTPTALYYHVDHYDYQICCAA